MHYPISKSHENVYKTIVFLICFNIHFYKALLVQKYSKFAAANQEEANRLVNQLLEEAEKGAVSAQLIEKVRQSTAYENQPFVKEIVDSMLELQSQQQQQQPKRSHPKKMSTTKMSKMARQNSRDPEADWSDGGGNISLSMDLPDLVKSQRSTTSQPDLPPDLVGDDQQITANSHPLSRQISNASTTTDVGANLKSKVDEVIVEEQDVDSTDFEDIDLDLDEEKHDVATAG